MSISMDPEGISAIAEAQRRRAGLGGSAAGIPGGAPVANANVPANPLAQSGLTPTNPAVQGTMPPAPTAENPLQGAESMMSKAAPNSEQMLIKYLGDHLKKYAPQPGQPTLQMP